MQINSPEIYKELKEYEFVFSSGVSLPFMMDETAGDTLQEEGEYLVVNLVEKPSRTNPDLKTSPERVKIYKSQLAAVYERVHKLREPSPEEKFNMVKTLHKATGTVN